MKNNSTKITLRNDFHNTETVVFSELFNYGTHLGTSLTTGQWKRVRKTLCGMSDCKCGGLRGPQFYSPAPHSPSEKKLIVEFSALNK